MNLALAQVAQQHSVVGTLLLMIGVAALLFVFRRNIVQRIRQRRLRETAPRTSGKTASRLINDIDANWWLKRYRGALKFQRGAASINVEQAALLKQITVRQADRRQEWHDGQD